jgi:hypothetical protein
MELRDLGAGSLTDCGIKSSDAEPGGAARWHAPCIDSSQRFESDPLAKRGQVVIAMMSTISHPKHWSVARRGTQLVAHALLALVAIGCDDDTIIYNLDDPPATPTGVTTVTGDGWVEVFWNPVYEDDVMGYGVYRSSVLQGPYQRIATVSGRNANSYLDTGLVNGVTLFYAVDAFDDENNESDLSYEDAFDTPRPSGQNVLVWSRQYDPASSGIDLSDYNLPMFVTAWNAADTDVYFQLVNGVLYAKGTLIGGYWNDIQDLGFTSSMDEVSWAPSQGWSVSPDGVELIVGHTYIVWTWDNYFAKFRVTDFVEPTPGIPSGAVIDWAYQIDQGNPELRNARIERRSRDESGRDAS